MEPSLALKNWIPIRIAKDAPELLCEWLFTGEKEFTEPFFDETIAACRYANSNNRRYKVVSDLNAMAAWARYLTAVPPAAIIFHVSRCGSTLLSQLLAEDKQNIVLSEVPFFDEILRMPLQRPDEDWSGTEGYLSAAVRFYGQQRNPNQQRLLIKADSWHLHFYEQYRNCFPGVPFFLLYRHPLEVLHSQQKQRGVQSVPGLIEPSVFGFTKEQGSDTNLNRYMSHVLTSYFQKMIHILQNDPLAFSFDYLEGMNTISQQLYARLNLPLEKELAERFEQRCRFHAKRPNQLFEEEQQNKDLASYLEPAFSLYRQLTSLRRHKP
jgi:hypothetical protein